MSARRLGRRRFLAGALAVAAAAPRLARAQSPRRIAYLGNSSPKLEDDLVAAFRAGLRERGYVEGESVVVDFYWAEGQYERFPAMVAKALASKADVIVTAGTPGALAAKRATSTVPIVFAVIADPVGIGIVPSLARPGANLTGSATMLHELAGKRLDLLKALVPGVARIAVVWNSHNPANERFLRELQTAARKLSVTIDPLIDGGQDRTLDAGLATLSRGRVDALVVEPDRALLARRARFVAAAAQHRLPAIYPYREYVEGGGLASYAPSFPALFRRAADYVDRILKGASPGSLPIEQPTSFEFVVNVKTAKTLGLTVPPALLLQAEQIIE